jgi:hypothetical protein
VWVYFNTKDPTTTCGRLVSSLKTSERVLPHDAHPARSYKAGAVITVTMRVDAMGVSYAMTYDMVLLMACAFLG